LSESGFIMEKKKRWRASGRSSRDGEEVWGKGRGEGNQSGTKEAELQGDQPQSRYRAMYDALIPALD
jgi:ribosomal protein L19E